MTNDELFLVAKQLRKEIDILREVLQDLIGKMNETRLSPIRPIEMEKLLDKLRKD